MSIIKCNILQLQELDFFESAIVIKMTCFQLLHSTDYSYEVTGSIWSEILFIELVRKSNFIAIGLFVLNDYGNKTCLRFYLWMFISIWQGQWKVKNMCDKENTEN